MKNRIHTYAIPRSLLLGLLILCMTAVLSADSEYGSNSSNVSIPDNGGWVSSSITISGAPSDAVVTGVDVSFSCVHTYSGDLNVDVNDANFSRNLDIWSNEGGSADNPSRTVYNNSTFNGLPVNGRWYLYAGDTAAGDTGYIDSWWIRVYYENNDQTFAVYARIDSLSYGTDADGDGYYETYDFRIGVDGDVSSGSASIYARMVCTTTGQAWWSTNPWTISGTATDYHYFSFDETDFAGQISGNTSLDFTVELWDSAKANRLATDTSVTGEPVRVDHYVAPTYGVYGIINNLAYGTDADGDGYYETYDFRIGIDGDVSTGSASIYARMVCTTTGQAWWSTNPWTISGTATDYHYFNFDETDFAGQISGNTSLDFTVELWDSAKANRLATDTSVTGEPVRVDHYVAPTYGVYGIINNLAYGTDADGDGYYETYDFRIGIDGDVSTGSVSIYARMVCTTTGQAWWSTNPWTISGTATDYHYFSFDETDFAGQISGNTSLDFTVELWDSAKANRLATDTSVTGEPVRVDHYVAPTYGVYGIINNLAYGTDGDGDGYYETYDFRIGIDGDVSTGSASIYARMVCTTTGQAWWSTNPWTISGTATDYHYFSFDEADFEGHVSGNTSLDFTVELWDSSKANRLAFDTTVTGEPVRADSLDSNIPTRFRGDHFVNKTAKIGIPLLLEAKLERNTLGYIDISGQTVHFEIYYSGSWHQIADDNIGGTDFVTDGNGIASVYYTVPKSLAAGSYTIRARFDGSGTYNGCQLSRTLTVRKPRWLVLLYLCADNNLEAASVEDFYEELLTARGNDNVSICVLYDRAAGFSSEQPLGGDDWTTTRYYRIGNDAAIYNDWGEQNLGSPTVLQSFVDIASSQCSADHTALILWNHGSGWKQQDTGITVKAPPIKSLQQTAGLPEQLLRPQGLPDLSGPGSIKGICSDDTGDILRLSEVRSVLRSFTNNGASKIALLGYDACLMGMVEVAYDAADFASYMVASEDNESGDGWEYDAILGQAAITAATTPLQWGQTLVDESIQVTLGCWDLSRMNTRFNEIAGFAGRMNQLITSSTVRTMIANARTASRRFSGGLSFVDLRQFATQVAANTTDATLRTRAQTVANGQANTSFRVRWRSTYTDANTLGGLSIYFPSGTGDSGYSNYFQDSYLLFTTDTDQTWDEFLQLYFQDNRVYFDTDKETCNVPEGGSTNFSVRLTSQPAIDVTVSVSRVSGDSNITVSSGSTLSFTPSNWNTYRTVTLSASEDADDVNGTATIRLSGTGIPNKYISAVEQDNDQVVPSITVTSPNGGEHWITGETRNITWAASGGVNSVNIDYSTSGFNGSYSPIASSVSFSGNLGGYPWIVPNVDSNLCVVRVRDTDGNPSDAGDAYFTIAPRPSITVTSPNDGEQWDAGTSENITWDYDNLSGTVTIRLYKGGSSVMTLGTAAATARSFQWDIPTDISGGNDYRVHLSAGAPANVSDFSNNYFTIIPTAAAPHPDMNGDGKVDILWRHYAAGTGENVVWYMNGISRTGAAYLPRLRDTNWHIAGTGDFNGDGRTDILWRYTAGGANQGQNAVWYMNGVTRTGVAILPRLSTTDWELVAVDDFNGDGKPDILWRCTAACATQGSNVVWFMNGATRTGAAYLPRLTDTGWEIAGTGDFNGDGKADLFWRYTTDNANRGQNAVWYMNGVNRTGVALLPRLNDLNWIVADCSDYNGDGNIDILWRNTGSGADRGRNAAWFMNGVTRTGVGLLPTATDLTWKIEN